MLYLGLYSEDHTISKNDLVRQWTAQGFISKSTGQDPEDIALCYSNEIVDRSIVQPAYTDSTMYCPVWVHDMMLDIIINKCKEKIILSLQLMAYKT